MSRSPRRRNSRLQWRNISAGGLAAYLVAYVLRCPLPTFCIAGALAAPVVKQAIEHGDREDPGLGLRQLPQA